MLQRIIVTGIWTVVEKRGGDRTATLGGGARRRASTSSPSIVIPAQAGMTARADGEARRNETKGKRNGELRLHRLPSWRRSLGAIGGFAGFCLFNRLAAALFRLRREGALSDDFARRVEPRQPLSHFRDRALFAEERVVEA